MAEPSVVAIFWLTAGLLVGGALAAGVAPAAARRLGADVERARTWAMRVALGSCAGAGAAVVTAALRRLVSCTSPAAPGSCPEASRVVVSFPTRIEEIPPFDLSIHVDALASLFLALVGFCATCIALYSFGWLRGDPLRHGVAGAFNLFVGGTLLTIVVDNAFWLLVALELITLPSAHLVRYRGRSGGPLKASRAAIRTYLLVSHAGLICLFAGLLPVIVTRRELDFSQLGSPGAPPPAATLSFILVLAGLALRAGITPFHAWVPAVHPQLPTNTHAMMSAVMLKIAVYLMIRLFFGGTLGPVRWWWGVVVLLLAGLTAVVTVFYALVSKDLKTALAYHSVENVGIILAGIGLALLFGDDRLGRLPALRGVAALALVASLYHVVNHALFKTLLFLGTGCIEKIAGTVETRRLGGLLRRAPTVGVTFLLGTVAIAGFPPLNGFVSEWLTLQALFAGRFAGRELDGGEQAIVLVAMAALLVCLVTLAMAFALTAMAFVKIAGEALLGRPRDGGRAPGQVALTMRSVLVLLAAVCLVLGLQPWLLVPWLSAAVASVHAEVSTLQAAASGLVVQVDQVDGRYTASLPTWPLLLLCAIPLLLVPFLRGGPRRPVWVGGEPFDPRTMQYTGAAVSALVWEPIARPPGDSAGDSGGGTAMPGSFRLSERQVVVDYGQRLFDRILGRIIGVSQWIGDRLQNGDVRRYLLYIFVVFILALALLRGTA